MSAETNLQKARATVRRMLNGEPTCGVCDVPSAIGSELRCTLAPDHETAHRNRGWLWDNAATGALAENEGKTW